MTDNIKLPPMPKPHTPPVFATAANTPSVKAGYELGGYEKTPLLFDEHQLEAYAREAVRLNAQADAKPIYQYQLATGGWIDQTRDSYEYNKANGVKGLRIVYEAAPQPAQQPPMNTPCSPNGIVYRLPPIVLTGYQLRNALGFVAPDGIHEQMEQQVCIALRDNVLDDDGTTILPPGLFVWLEEYPEEGMLPLVGKPTSETAAPQPAKKVDLGCPSCANADSWGLPDKPLCNACTIGSNGVGTGYIPLSTWAAPAPQQAHGIGVKND